MKQKGKAAVVLDEMNKIVIFLFSLLQPRWSVRYPLKAAFVRALKAITLVGVFEGECKSSHCNQEPKPYLSQF